MTSHTRRITVSSTDFDEQVFAAFERCREQEVLRTDPLAHNVQRRIIPGNLSMVSAHEPDLFAKKRPAAFSPQVAMDTPFNPESFHFNKVLGNGEQDNSDNKEVMMQVAYLGQIHTVLVNVSPLMYGHGLLIPFREKCLPQRLTPEAIGLGLHVLKKSQRFRIGFNSLGAFSSVNHLHLHFLYPDELDRLTNEGTHGTLFEKTKRGFPIEHAPIGETVLDIEGEGGLLVTTLDWKAPSFSLVSSCVSSLQNAIANLVAELHKRRIPHNVLLINCGHYKGNLRKSQIVDEDSPALLPQNSFRAVVIPRKPQHCFDAKTAGFNAALGEISGYVLAHSRQSFEDLEEDTIVSLYQEQVAIAPEVLKELSTWIQETKLQA